MLEFQIQIHPIIGQQNGRTYGTNTDTSRNSIWQSGKCNSFGTQLKRQIQKHLGRTPGSSNETIIFMCMFNDFDWTKKGDTETCLHNPKEVVAFATRFQATRLVLRGAQIRKFVVERKFQRTSRQMRYCRIASGGQIQVSRFPPDISSRTIIAWTAEKRRKQFPFPRNIRQQEASHQDHIGKQLMMYLQSNLPVV